MRDTTGLRRRSALVVGSLLLLGTLTQGATHAISVEAEASALSLAHLGELEHVVAQVQAVAAQLERVPTSTAAGRALAATSETLAESAERTQAAGMSEVNAPRISLALASVRTEVRAIRQAPIVSPRALARLQSRAAVLGEELQSARPELEADVRARTSWLRWTGWAGWIAMVLTMFAATRWLLGTSLRSINRSQRDLADAERAVLDAADGERVRLGQELHDGLCQQLGGLRLLAQAAQRTSSNPGAQDSLHTLEELAGRSLEMARTLSHGLYPGDVRATNLSGALERLGTELSELGTFDFSFEGPLELPTSVSDADAMQLYRIAQEAISNAARHGSPSRVRIELESEPLTLSIEDDGVGLSSTHDGSTTVGVGLSSMYARARALGAGIRFYSTPQEGTRVVVSRAVRPNEENDSLDELPLTPLNAWTKP